MDENEEKVIQDLYSAKQADNNDVVIKDDCARFTKQVKNGIKYHELDLSCQQGALTLLSRIPKTLRYFPKIKFLNLYGNLIRDEGLTRVFAICCNNPNVTRLDVGSNDLSDGSALVISEIITKTNVESLQIGRKGASFSQNWLTRDGLVTIIDAAKTRNTVKCLGIAGIASMKQKKTQKWKDFSIHISQLISTCKNLVTLDLTDSGFHTNDQYELAKGLRENKNLKHLNLSGNQFAPGETLMQAVCNINSLISLNLRNCGIGEAACDILSSRITGKNAWGLINIDISSNPIGTKGIKFLLSALSSNIYLTSLNISATQCDQQIAPKLEQLLTENKTIDDLDISKNNLGDEIAEIIGKVLSTSDVLRKLNVASTRITDAGGKSIAEACKFNTTLKSINLSDNFFTKQAGYELLDMFQENETLHFIDVSANQIDCFALSGFATLCSRNKNVRNEKRIGEMRKQYIHLSIQNSKIPAHNEKLHNTQGEHEEVQKELEKLREKIEKYDVESQIKITELDKSIEEIEKMKEMQRENIEKTEKAFDEFKVKHQETKKKLDDDIKLQHQRYSNCEFSADKADKETEEMLCKTEIEKAQLQKETEEVEKLISEARKILENKEDIIGADIPDYPYDDERKEQLVFKASKELRRDLETGSKKSVRSVKSQKTGRIIKPKK